MKTRRKSVRVSIFASCQNKTITTLWAVLSAWMTAVEGEDSRYNDDDEEEMMKLHGKVFLAWSRWIVLSSKEGSNDFCFSLMLNSSPYIHISRGNYHHYPIMCWGWMRVVGYGWRERWLLAAKIMWFYCLEKTWGRGRKSWNFIGNEKTVKEQFPRPHLVLNSVHRRSFSMILSWWK